MADEFEILLPSNVKSLDEDNPNKLCSFTTKLFKRIVLPNNELWKVGLSEISFTKSWYNIKNYSMITFFNKIGDIFYEATPQYEIETNSISRSVEQMGYELRLLDPKEQQSYYQLMKPGYFDNVEALIWLLNLKLTKLQQINSLDKAPQLEFDKHSHRVKMKSGLINKNNISEVIYPYFGEEIEKILGFTDENGITFRSLTQRNVEILTTEELQMITNAFEGVKCYIGPRCVEFSSSNNSIYLYSNIVEHNFIGDTFAQILRVVKLPSDAKFGEQVTINYINPNYIPLQTRSFDTISLELNDDTGRAIPFQFGRVIIKLSFKKYEQLE
jgi:hypothetical protein